MRKVPQEIASNIYFYVDDETTLIAARWVHIVNARYSCIVSDFRLLSRDFWASTSVSTIALRSEMEKWIS